MANQTSLSELRTKAERINETVNGRDVTVKRMFGGRYRLVDTSGKGEENLTPVTTSTGEMFTAMTYYERGLREARQ